MSRTWLVVVAALAGCLDVDLVGRRCGQGHPCLDGFTCREGRCATGGAIDEDAGAPNDDAGTPGDDAGVPMDDAGAPIVDGGAPIVDGGAPIVDGGAPIVDGGAPIVDGGAPIVDGGSPIVDAGVQDVDAGPGGVIFTETFDGQSGSWSAARWSVGTTGGAADVALVADEGTITVGDTNQSSGHGTATHAAVVNAEVTLAFRFDDTAPGVDLEVALRADGAYNPAGHVQTGYVASITNGGAGSVGSPAGGGASLATWSSSATTQTQRLRMRVVADRVQVRTWLDGDAEPSTWSADVVDTVVTAAGVLQIAVVRQPQGAHVVHVDDVVVRVP